MILRAGVVLAAMWICGGLTIAQTAPPQSQQVAQAQTEPVDAKSVVYFLVDASGSMKDEVAEARSKLDAKLTLLNVDSAASVTFFGGQPSSTGQSVRCEDEIVLAAPQTPQMAPRNFPPLGGPNDKTAIGKGIDTVISEGGETASIVLISDGIEECGANFRAIREEYPKASFQVFQVGNNPNPELFLLEQEPASQPPTVIDLSWPDLLDVKIVPIEPAEEVGSSARLFWVILLFLSALSATLFCLQSGERTNSLQDQLSQLAAKSESDLARIYNPTKRVPNRDGTPTEVRKSDQERFKIYWLLNRNGNLLSFGTWASGLFLVSGLLWSSLAFPPLLLSFLPEDFVQDARNDSWRFLNSNFGAYSFAGSIVALIGFAAVQWWQTLEVKQKLMLQAGIVSSERAGVARRQYEKSRRKILAIKLSLPLETGWSWFPPEPVQVPGFDALRIRLLEFLAPPFEDASIERQAAIENFTSIREPLALASLLKSEGQLDDTQFQLIKRLLDEARVGNVEKAVEITQRLMESFVLLPGKTSAS